MNRSVYRPKQSWQNNTYYKINTIAYQPFLSQQQHLGKKKTNISFIFPLPRVVFFFPFIDHSLVSNSTLSSSSLLTLPNPIQHTPSQLAAGSPGEKASSFHPQKHISIPIHPFYPSTSHLCGLTAGEEPQWRCESGQYCKTS